VLKRLGLLVHLFPVHPQDLHEEGLDESVLAHDGQGQGPSLGGEPDALPGLMFKEASRRHRLDHRGDRARGQAERLGERPGRNHPILVG